MKLHKVAMFALAASFSVTGLTVLNTPAAHADVTYDDLLRENGGDLEKTHWAANAIEQLVDKYGVMSGYPDKKFRGERTLTRYEMAAALYNVMKQMDEKIANIPTDETDLSGLATKEDLKQLAALQMEFKKELDMLKEGQMDLAKRVDMLERVKVSGMAEVRYRDRIAVTDGTDTSSPLFAAGNSNANTVVGDDLATSAREGAPVAEYTNNRGDAARDANGLPTSFSAPDNQAVTVDDLVPFRVQAQLNVDAMLTDNIKLSTGFDMFELGGNVSGQGFGNGGHNINESTGFVFRKAAIEIGGVEGDGLGNGASFKVGLDNFRKDLNPNTGLTNHFNNPNWVGRGYGFVGWGADELALSRQGVDGYNNSVSRYWAGGLNASMVDPDSHLYNQVTSPSASFNAGWGWGKFFVGANYGSVQANRAMAAAGNLGSGAGVMGNNAAFTTAGADSALFAGAALQGLDRNGRLVGNNLALPSQYGDGYGVVGLDLSFFQEVFPVRLGVHAMSYLNDNMLDFANPSRKEISGVLDLGWNQNFGMTVGVNKSFIGYDRHSLGLFFNDLGGSGFDIQLGANAATRGGLFNVGDLAAANAGLAIGIPFLNMGEGKDNIKLILGARQSIGDNMGAEVMVNDVATNFAMFKDSGLTVSLPYMNVGGTPLNIRAEYSMLLADAVWEFRPVAHDLSVITSYHF